MRSLLSRRGLRKGGNRTLGIEAKLLHLDCILRRPLSCILESVHVDQRLQLFFTLFSPQTFHDSTNGKRPTFQHRVFSSGSDHCRSRVSVNIRALPKVRTVKTLTCQDVSPSCLIIQFINDLADHTHDPQDTILGNGKLRSHSHVISRKN